jgi:hypothetical protein
MGRIEARLQQIPFAPRSLAEYDGLVPADQAERALALAEPLAGARVLIVGGPGEPGSSASALSPLLADLGVEVERAVLHGDRAFQRCGRELADALRGAPWEGAERDWREYREACEAAAVAVDPRRFDAVLVEGAAAAPLIEGRRGGPTAWAWGTGVDASAPGEGTWPLLAPLLDDYSLLRFALPAFVPGGVGGARLRVVPGAFDPLAERNRRLSPPELSRLGRRLGLDLDRPLVADLGRLDAWADPLAAIAAWQVAGESIEGLQLAIGGRVDHGDPEATSVLAEVRAFADGAPDLHLLSDRRRPDADLNALGRIARCTVGCRLGDEFDPGLAASLWRGTPAVGSGASAAAQLRDGRDGFLVADAAERAERLAELAGDPARAAAMGRSGRDRAASHFGVVRLLGDALELIGSLLGVAVRNRPAAEPAAKAAA